MQNSSNFDLGKVIETAQSVILQPVSFYRNMQKSGGYIEPLIFMLVMAVIGGLIIAFFSLFGGGRFAAVGIAAVIFMPIMVAIWGFIGAAIMFVIWKLMGSNESYETAYRCVAYSSAIFPVIMLIGLIPYLGSAIGVIWGIYLMIAASTEVHGINKNTAMIVFGILGFISLIMNLSAEQANRQMQDKMEKFGQQMEHSMDNIGEMTPEEAGKALGEFMKGLEEASKN